MNGQSWIGGFRDIRIVLLGTDCIGSKYGCLAAEGTDSGQQAVASLLQPIMWRNTKLSVQSEGAGFQPKHHHLVQLQFDSPEWTFYEDAISELRDLIKDAETVEEVLAGFAATEPPTDPTQAKGRMPMRTHGSQRVEGGTFVCCRRGFCCSHGSW